jgi:release factor glutamine methyltransferase
MTRAESHRTALSRAIGLREALLEGQQALRRLPHSSPRLEAELLLSKATGYARSHLYSWAEQPIEPSDYRQYRELLKRRASGEPIAYILGRQEFWSLELRVTPATLIPRPDSELLVERALELLPADRPIRLADLGTGSGALAAALARERPHWQIMATDRSAQALAVARGNFRRLGLAQIETLQGDWLAPLAGRRFHCVLSNPPYIPVSDPHLRRGDLRFEPRMALAGGPDGLEAIRRIASEVQSCLEDQGLLLLEHGYDQGAGVRRLLHQQGYGRVESWRDLAGRERVTGGFSPTD